jgi:hypothetical protein
MIVDPEVIFVSKKYFSLMREVNLKNVYDFCCFITKKHAVSLAKKERLDAVCSENHSKHIHNLCGRNGDPF